MKKSVVKFNIITAVIIAFCTYSFCGLVHTEKYISSAKTLQAVLDVEEKENKEVLSLVPVDIDGKEIIQINSMHLNDVENACLESTPIMENYLPGADAVVKGIVRKIEYFDSNGIPWSKLHVFVDETIEGNIEEGQIVSIYVMEGYLYNGESQNEVVSIEGDDMGLHEVGEKSIYAITAEDGNSIFEKGSYRRTFSCFSEYRYIDKQKKYNLYDINLSEEEERMTEEQLILKINEYISE